MKKKIKEKKKKDCKVCREVCEKDKKCYNAAINEVRRSRIVLKLLKEFKNDNTVINADNDAVYICIELNVVISDS